MIVKLCVAFVLIYTFLECVTYSFVPKLTAMRCPLTGQLYESEWKGDFDDFVGDEDDSYDVAKLFQQRFVSDRSAIRTRLFSLGKDLVLSDFVGNLGFDEVTDWQYYYEDEEERRKIVDPNPFDKSKPKRTRSSSGSVVRLFRGEFVGTLGGMLGSKGLDRRILVKEFTGKLALQLAENELNSLSILQSDLITGEASNSDDWNKAAAARSVMERQDNTRVVQLLTEMQKTPYLGILGEVNLAELEGNLEPNEFYRALGVPPPKPDAIWIVYEYVGLSSLQIYSQPAEKRRARLPPKRGFFGNIVEPPVLPPWRERANYVVKGILKKSIEAVALLHESGIVHRSIGRSSFFLTTTSMDKTEASSPYMTQPNRLVVKLADYGFSGLYNESTLDDEFLARARSFNLFLERGENSIRSANFALAEDFHALGFVMLGLLLASLAEIPDATYQVPNTDEDTLQRLFAEIFDKDIRGQFREYVEAEDVWTKVVELLDEKEGAGWTVLETLLLAREKAVQIKETTQIFSIRGLLSNPFFA